MHRPSGPSAARRENTILLAADVGNTNITLGFFEGETLRGKRRLETRSCACPERLADGLLQAMRASGFAPDQLEAVAVSSVVPEVTESFETCVRARLGTRLFIVREDIETGINIEAYRNGQLGADRLTDMAAAFRFYGGPVLVIDFGTATTYDAVSEDGAFLGGVVSPGIRLAAEALWEKTAKLPRVALRKPERILGRDTVESMQSGLVLGQIGQVEYFIETIRAQVGRAMKVVATGGLSGILEGNTAAIDWFDADLTLRGVQYLYRRNRNDAANAAAGDPADKMGK